MAESKTLNSRQIRFIDCYLENGGNGKQAAISAGYAEGNASKQAYRFLTLPEFRHLQIELKRRQQELQQTTGATSEAIRQGLWDAFCVARQNLTVTQYDDQGHAMAQFFDSKAATAMSNIAGELNKMDGNHAVVRQRLELSGHVQVDHAEILNAARRRLEQSRKDKNEPESDK